jgi:hypothetical protein
MRNREPKWWCSAKIYIRFYKEQSNAFRTLRFEILGQREIANESWKIDLLSKVCWPLKFNGSWSTIMHKLDGSYPGKSKITFLPMIDKTHLCVEASKFEYK